MNRGIRRLLGISTTVGITLLLTWIAVQGLIIRPAIGDRERARVSEAIEAAELMRGGMGKHAVEDLRGIDLRLYSGDPEQPPPGPDWVREATTQGIVWKRPGGKYEIAAWNGTQWAVLHEDLPVATTLTLALLAAGIPVIMLMFGLGQRAGRHQAAAERGLARIAAGHLSERLDEAQGSSETRRVAVTVNRMAAKMQALMASDRQRMAGLSHELRTPLTRIRLELGMARREGASPERLARVEQDIERFDAMLTEMLELSQLELAGAESMRAEVVDLAGLVELVLDEERWPEVQLRGSGTAYADPKLVARLVRNLLRNSAQHAPGAARWVEVSEDTLLIADDGPGMRLPSEVDPRKAFQRGEDSKGHGLGLAIVSQIAQLHDAALHFSASPGLEVKVRFPPQAQTPS